MINIIFICTLCILTVSWYIFYKIDDIITFKRYSIEQFENQFEYFLSKCYDIVYQNDLILYIESEGQSIPNKERETIERNYIKQVILYIGKRNYKIFKRYFGSEQTMITNMLSYLRKRINNDGLFKAIRTTQMDS